MITLGKKVKKINIILISLLALFIIIAMFQVGNIERILLMATLIISSSVLLFINRKAADTSSFYKSPLYCCIFTIIISITIYISGTYNSILYPALFLFAFLHAAVNFSIRTSTGLTILIIFTLWLFLLQDPALNKIHQVAFMTLYIILIQLIIKWLAKEYKFYKQKKIRDCKECIKKFQNERAL